MKNKIKRWVAELYQQPSQQILQKFEIVSGVQLAPEQKNELLNAVMLACERAHQNGYRNALDEQPEQMAIEDTELGCNDYRPVDPPDPNAWI